MDDTSFIDDFRADFYIDDMGEAKEAVHGDGFNTPSNEPYGEMMAEERRDYEDIYNATYNKYVGTEVIMDVP